LFEQHPQGGAHNAGADQDNFFRRIFHGKNRWTKVVRKWQLQPGIGLEISSALKDLAKFVLQGLTFGNDSAVLKYSVPCT
jgi:hypothetical protein